MVTVMTWTGWEATALRKALRMTVTDFAEHLGAGRRTVVKWSSQGSGVRLSPQMQAALDTVLTRASADARERFDDLRAGAGFDDVHLFPSAVGVASVAAQVVDTDEGYDLDSGGDVRRRGLLAITALSGVAVSPAVTRLLDVLMPKRRPGDDPAPTPTLEDLAKGVASAKVDYQACRYKRVLDQVVNLLPALDAARAAGSGDGSGIDVLATDLYHVVGSVLLKLGDHPMALVAAERSRRCAQASGDPVAAGTSARIVTHALMSNGHIRRAVDLAQASATELDRDTGLSGADAVAVYGALVLRGAIAAARVEDRDAAQTMLGEAMRAAGALGHDGNDRWTGFGPTNVLLHQVHVAVNLGDAGTAIAFARQVRLDKVTLVERQASLFVDVAQAYSQWGRHEQALCALRTAQRFAPEEIRARPAVRRVVGDLTAMSRGHLRTQVAEFAASAGVRL